MIGKEHIEKGYSYKLFGNMVDNLLAEGEATNGNNSEFPLLEFAKSNVQRIDNLDKTVVLMPELIEELQGLFRTWIWIVLAEGWWGDVSQNLPVIAKIAEVTENIVSGGKPGGYGSLPDQWWEDSSFSESSFLCNISDFPHSRPF